MEHTEFKQILKAQDDRICATGVDVWVGMEPTFTRRFAETPEWLSEALGPEKPDYAYKLLTEVCQRQPGGVVLHTLGRQYGGEDKPRWSVGYYEARQHQFSWDGPPDPYLFASAQATTSDTSLNIQAFWQALNAALIQTGCHSTAFTLDNQDLKYRLLFRCDDNTAVADLHARPQLARASVHTQKIPVAGLIDELAQGGDFLLCMDSLPADEKCPGRTGILIELPALPTVEVFVQLLQAITQAAKATAVPCLMMQGFPPPVDASVAWTTITPDPAVIEINHSSRTHRSHTARTYPRCEVPI